MTTTNPPLTQTLRQVRSDTYQLSSHLLTMSGQCQDLQRVSHDSYNRSHEAVSLAFEATIPNPYRDNGSTGGRAKASLGMAAQNQPRLESISAQAAAYGPWSKNELVRLAGYVSWMVSAAPSAPVAGALQRALGHLEAAQRNSLPLDVRRAVGQAGAHLGYANQCCDGIAMAPPGSDVSYAGRAVCQEVQSAKAQWAQVASQALQSGLRTLDVRTSCLGAVSAMDEALAMLATN